MVYMFVFSGNGRQTLPITKYYGLCEQAGTVEKLEYTSYVYDDAGNPGEVMPKYCYVYLPYGYDPEQSYNIQSCAFRIMIVIPEQLYSG